MSDRPPATGDDRPVLEIAGLRTWFRTRSGSVRAVDGVDLTVRSGEVLGLVGESGSGKSVTMLSALRLVERPGRIVAGRVHLEGEDVLAMSKRRLQAVRGDRASMVFQQPNASLHPCFTAGRQISEVWEVHEHIRRKAGVARAVDMLRRVGLPDPDKRVGSYPHQLSGGQAQRVMIAMALAAQPALLIADEPTTALDVTIQAQILDLLRQLQHETRAAVVVITHDLGVVAEMADRVAVMYGGQIVEEASVGDLFARPLHPYTVGLLGSVPVIGKRSEELAVIPGRVPTLVDPAPGCRFAPRCPQRRPDCTEASPGVTVMSGGRRVRCFLHGDAVDELVDTVPVEVGGRRR